MKTSVITSAIVAAITAGGFNVKAPFASKPRSPADKAKSKQNLDECQTALDALKGQTSAGVLGSSNKVLEIARTIDNDLLDQFDVLRGNIGKALDAKDAKAAQKACNDLASFLNKAKIGNMLDTLQRAHNVANPVTEIQQWAVAQLQLMGQVEGAAEEALDEM